MISRNQSASLIAKIGVDNFSTSIGQKDKIIQVLEKELEGFRALRERYDRLRDRRAELLEQCEHQGREISISKDTQDSRLETNHKCLMQLKALLASLGNELQNKQYQLKNLKTEAQSLMNSNEQKQSDIIDKKDCVDTIKTSMQILKTETERIQSQICQTKEETERIKEYQNETKSANEKIKNQNHNTQSFIRKLNFEESKLTENLSVFEDQNNEIDEVIGDLNKVHEMTKNKIRETRDTKEELGFKIKSKESEKGRIIAEYNAKVKQFKTEREKERLLKEQIETRKSETQRLNVLLKEMNGENDGFMKENLEVEQINNQLQSDLTLCRKHLENLDRNNNSVKDSLNSYYQINQNAIKKLANPTDDGWVELHMNSKNGIEDMDTGEGFMQSI